MAHWTRYVLASAVWLQLQTNAYAEMDESNLKSELRSQGYGGVESVLEQHQEELRASRYGSSGPEVEAAHELLDEVCQQRDCAHSRLFWHTELTAALEQAGREGKPVLTLRLLGKLTDPLSCANSRFFRAVLYPDPDLRRLLQNQYVLHWESVGSIPKIEVDFGNGRKLVSTITGNSVHYVLDRKGRILDAIPGLVHPRVFRAQLEQVAAAEQKLYHKEIHSFTDLAIAWWAPAKLPDTLPKTLDTEADRAAFAVGISLSKLATERPLLRALRPDTDNILAEAGSDDIAEEQELYQQLPLSEEAVKLMREIHGDELFQPTLDRFRKTLAADTARNLRLQVPIRQRILVEHTSGKRLTADALDEWIYREVFASPLSDDWRGLAPDAVFSGVPKSIRSPFETIRSR